MLENAISRAIENVAEMETYSVAVHRSPLNVNQNNGIIHRYRDNSMKIIVTGVPENGDSTNARIDIDFTKIDSIFNRMGS